MSIKITCYGPRGSLPSPSTPTFSTTKYGGNTSCYLVQAGPFTIILDLGSGAMRCGDDLMRAGLGVGRHNIVLLSHFHWDHIQGGPFMVPLFIGSNTFHFHGFAPAGTESHVPFERIVETVLASQQEAPNFPVPHTAMPGVSDALYHTHPPQFSQTFCYVNASGEYEKIAPELAAARYGDNAPYVIKITTIPLNHPNGCLGYAIEYLGKKVVYCTDNEPLAFPNAQITKHAKDADWLLLDGQYTASELAGPTQGFGHGTPRLCVDQAKACGAKHLVVHHHDPRRDDDKVDAMEGDAIIHALDIGYDGQVEFAREGAVWTVGE